MTTDSAAWRCPVCDGVNHGGRVCTTCGETLPEGFVPRDATRRTAPSTGGPPTVVPVPRPRRAPTFDDIFGPAAGASVPVASREEPTAPGLADLFSPSPAPAHREEPRRPSFADLFRAAAGEPMPGEPAPPEPRAPRDSRERREPRPRTFDDIFGPEY